MAVSASKDTSPIPIFAGRIAHRPRNDAAVQFDLSLLPGSLADDGFVCGEVFADDYALLTQLTCGPSGRDGPQGPPSVPEHRLAIVADARLHARADLARELQLSEQDDDLVLLVAAYAKWGVACPEHVQGEYAFAIWDPTAQTLFCARDHIGAKPFFFMHREHELIFASDLRSILDTATQTVELDDEWVIERLAHWNKFVSGRTYYRGLKSLAPGHSLTVKVGQQPHTARYWRPEDVEPLVLDTDQQYADRLLQLVEVAVADCLPMAATPATSGYGTRVGVHVSGGLDSSAIASIAVAQLRDAGQPPPKLFSWQPAATMTTAESNEHQLLDAVSAQLGLDIHYASPSEDRDYNLFMQDGTTVPHSSTLGIEAGVQEKASQLGVGVILSGWGGDELTSHNGRSHYPWLFKTGRWRTLLRNAADVGQNQLVFLLAQAAAVLLPKRLMDMRRQASRPDPLQPSRRAQSMLHSDMPTPDRHAGPSRSLSVRDMQLYLLNNGHLTERIESWALHGRRLGIEYRYPLLDRRLIEFALSVPAEQFKRGRWKRFIFRNAIRDIVPTAVVENLSKDEPVRVDSSRSANRPAMARIGRELRSGALQPERTEFIDMDRLIEVLEGTIDERPGAAQEALKVLKFS